MSTKVQARHFHAGKLRKEIDGVEFVEVAESKGKDSRTSLGFKWRTANV